MFEELETELVQRIEEVISSYLGQLDDPGEVDSEDLAENIALRLEREKKS